MIILLKKIRRKILTKFKDSKQSFIANSKIGNKLGLSWKTNPEVLDLLTTSHCNSMCHDCSQMCRQAPSSERLTREQVKKFIKESIEKIESGRR